MHIDFLDQTNSISSDHLKLLKRLLLFTGKKEMVPSEAEVSISFVNKEEIQNLNHTYRNIDEPTDVISFELQQFQKGETTMPNIGEPIALGDIVICLEIAKEQAHTYNHSVERELGFLIVHGFLHLLGYDHLTKADEEKMFQKQTELLQEFGLER